MMNVENGTTVEHDRMNLKLIINDPDEERFEISGFKDTQEMNFLI